MTTLERLSRILVQRYKLDPARLTPEQPLGSLGIDSLGMVEILFFIEEEFDVHLPSEGIAFGTLGEAAGYVDQLIAAQRAAPAPPLAQPAPAQPAASTDTTP
ncbi:MAG TPA: phosphopantetheine-binding protein [Steroidobacteraceae bacterium]|nr:phosphopantetheine-binding protein [Steroidobacteraceae bacterium]